MLADNAGKAALRTDMEPGEKTSQDYSTGESEDRSISRPRSTLDLVSRLEAILFAAPSPVEVTRLAAALEVTGREVEAAIEELSSRYAHGGLALQTGRSGIQLTTTPEAASDVERFLEIESTSRLSRAALEVLAVIAYQQPVTRPQVDSIRGVNSESSLGTLMRHGLVEEIGRSDAPGRPFLYVTTPEFLHYFGLESLEQLPPLNLSAQDVEPGEDPPDREDPDG